MLSVSDLHAQMWYWGRAYGGLTADNVSAIGMDGAGNIYMTGSFFRSIRFGDTTLTNGNFTGLYLVKFSPAGTLLWVTVGTGTGEYRDPSLAVDRQGNCYLTGSFTNSAQLGATVLSSLGSTDIFLAKCDSSGRFLWARHGGGEEPVLSRGIALDSLGNIFITGSFRNVATFGNFNVLGSGLTDVFVVKYNAAGISQWATACGGSESDVGNAIAADRYGNCYVTGDYAGTPVFGPYYLNKVGSQTTTDVFVMKLDPDGFVEWANGMGGYTSDHGYSIAADPEGNSYTCGSYVYTMAFGDTLLPSFGGNDIFILKYDAFGNYQWAQGAGGQGSDLANDIVIDGDGACYLTGRFGGFGGMTTFGGTGIFDAGRGDVFVASYDADGGFRWVLPAGSTESDQGVSIATSGGGEFVVAGTYLASIVMGDIVLSGIGSTDLFVARLGPSPDIMVGVVSPGPYCSGAPITIPFNVAPRPFNRSNIFTAQLSDAAGNFASPTALGTFGGTLGGVITAAIPATAPPGNSYRVRVVSSDPVTASPESGASLILGGPVKPEIVASDTLAFCAGDSVVLDAGAGYADYRWSNGATTRMITVRESGEFSVTTTIEAGCSGTSAFTKVVVSPLPEKPTVMINGLLLESSAADSYQWLLEDQVIDSATGRIYAAMQPGTYRVRVTNATGCSSESDPVTVSVSEVERERPAGDLLLYPQPTAGIFIVDLPAGCTGDALLVIRNGLGEEVMREAAPSGGGTYHRTVDLSGSPAGLYHIELVCGERRWNGRIVKR